jgi:hypothetical protein
MTCRVVSPPDGFLVVPELIEDLHSLRRSCLRPAEAGPGTRLRVMPSADFCLLTRCVAIQGASGFLMITLTILT